MTYSAAPSAMCTTSADAQTILVVEDDDVIRLCVSEYLCDAGYTVVEAADVAAAKDILNSQRVDLVFSDVNMPGRETGFALEQWVRKHFVGTTVLLTSGYPQAKADTDGLLVPLLLKPYRYRMLMDWIGRILRR